MSCEHVKYSLDKKFEKHYFLYTQTYTQTYTHTHTHTHQMIVSQLSFLTMEQEYTKH